MQKGSTMKATLSQPFILPLLVAICVSCLLPSGLRAATWDPAAADYSGHEGKTLYVSKLGDNSDGGTWQKAYRTIQLARPISKQD